VSSPVQRQRFARQGLSNPFVDGHFFGDHPCLAVRILARVGDRVFKQNMVHLMMEHSHQFVESAFAHEFWRVEKQDAGVADGYAHGAHSRVANETIGRKQMGVKRVCLGHPAHRNVEHPGRLASLTFVHPRVFRETLSCSKPRFLSQRLTNGFRSGGKSAKNNSTFAFVLCSPTTAS